MEVLTTSIPAETGKKFGERIAAGLREYLKRPGGREALDARTKARHERRERECGNT